MSHAGTVERGPMDHVCDFCSTPNPCWRYPAVDILMLVDEPSEDDHLSVGAWAACCGCSEIIEAGDRDKLVVNAFTSWQEQRGEASPEVLSMLRELFTSFFSARRGPRERLP